MKKRITKPMVVCIMTTGLIVASVYEANARKIFGKERTNEVAVNESVCGEGSVGISYTEETYFFGIKVSSQDVVECMD